MGPHRARAGREPLSRRAVALPVAVLLVAVACASGSGTVRGLVTDVTGDLTTVTRFTVLVEGDLLEFVPAPDGDFEFPLPHLRDHLRTGEPVLVTYEEREGELVAVALADG